uniref:Putative secreted protein n=1 Tax=Anopheles marajoara TaxID=58244 RepID=A0A2M4CEA3_9DIPT
MFPCCLITRVILILSHQFSICRVAPIMSATIGCSGVLLGKRLTHWNCNCETNSRCMRCSTHPFDVRESFK